MELQVVSFLLRHQPYIPALSELGRKVSRFLGLSSNLSLSEACVYDSIALLDWIWDSSCTSIAERSSGWSLHNFLRSDNDYYKWEFAKGMQFVARGGNMKILECFFQHFEGCGVTTDIVDLAACNGHLEVLIYLQEHTTIVHENFPNNWTGPGHYVCWGGDGIILACEEGHGNVAQWLVENWPHALSLEETETIIRSALAGGLMDLAQSLLPADRHIADYVTEFSHPLAFEMAVTSGRLNLNRHPNDVIVVVYNFAKAGRLDLIKRVCKNLPRDDENLREILAIDEGDSFEWRLVIKEAIRRDDMHMVDWLVKHPIGQASLIAAKATKTSLEFAIATTDTVMLQYLHDGDLLLAGDYMDGLVHAVQNGQLDAVQWFLLHAANLSNVEQYNLMDEAVKCGHLDILQFFHGSTSSIEEDFLRQIRLKGSGFKRTSNSLNLLL
ncbi:putative ankyrin repeat protein [Phytophthora citrophthora]|uniref:Ankyrin repeat protein n=1 Tax=Phytophthora citrophthora TaxID=4793 RepID=A0AAD9G1P9_9STRA|nr:putative ankyrin repeat protein [Phytophthora citrophthora]